MERRSRWQPCLDVINAAETDPIYLRGRGVESLTRESKVGAAECEGAFTHNIMCVVSNCQKEPQQILILPYFLMLAPCLISMKIKKACIGNTGGVRIWLYLLYRGP